jgi:phosphoribosylanthranilate isomerase
MGIVIDSSAASAALVKIFGLIIVVSSNRTVQQAVAQEVPAIFPMRCRSLESAD